MLRRSALVLLAVTALLAVPAPAAADPAQPGCPAPAPTACHGKPVPTQPNSAGSAPAGILGPFTVTDRHGVGIDHYDVYADDGGTFNVTGKLLLLVANLFFALARIWTGFTAWLIDWALRFGLVGVVAGPAQDLGTAYQTGLIGPLGLRHLFLTVTGAWCALLVFRGRVTRGIAEAALSLVISALAVTALADPVGLLLGPHGLMAQTRDVSVAVASLGLSHGVQADADPSAVSRPVTDALVDTLVRQPDEILNFGAVLDDPHHPDRCAATYDTIVATGPWYGHDGFIHPWDMMARCNPAYADYNRRPTIDRTFGAGFAMVAAIVINLLLDTVAIGLAVTPVLLAFEAVLAGAALVFAILPGPGRVLLYRRIGGITAALAGVIASVLFLTLFLTTIQAFLASGVHLSLPVRFLVIDVVAIGGWRWRKRLTAAARHLGTNTARRLEHARVGGAGHGGWITPATAGAAGGYALATYLGDTQRAFRRHVHRAQLATYRARRHLHAADRARRRGGPPTTSPGTPGPRTHTGSGRLIALLDATTTGRAAHRATTLAGGIGVTALKYTLGAPVYLPRATQTARRASARRSAILRGRFAQARAFRDEYTGNLSRLATTAATAANVARTGATHTTAAAILTATTLLGRQSPVTNPARQPVATPTAPRLPGGQTTGHPQPDQSNTGS